MLNFIRVENYMLYSIMLMKNNKFEGEKENEEKNKNISNYNNFCFVYDYLRIFV